MNVPSDIIPPFINATIKVMETMAMLNPVAGDIIPWDSTRSVGEVVGIVGLNNEEKNIKGFLSIGFAEATICQVVTNMLGEEFTAICDEVREAAGEIANMISGQARKELTEQGLKLQASLPSIISGKDLVVEGSDSEHFYIVSFQLESGPFEIGVCIETNA